MSTSNIKVGLMIPTYNAGDEFKRIIKLIESQNIDFKLRKIIIDSESNDETTKIASQNNFEVFNIQHKSFTHGLVRMKAINILNDCDYVFFMTQDVSLRENALQNLYNFIAKNSQMAVAYGRQMVNSEKENYFDIMDRKFNYPNKSAVKGSRDVENLGIKTVFSSDAFSIYDTKLLKSVGNFPPELRFSEDMYIAAKAISAGYLVGYCAEATVFHSNKLNLYDLFKRYSDIGLFHAKNPWIQENYGANESNGIRLVLTQIKELKSDGKLVKIPELLARSSIKYFGYTVGKIKGR